MPAAREPTSGGKGGRGREVNARDHNEVEIIPDHTSKVCRNPEYATLASTKEGEGLGRLYLGLDKAPLMFFRVIDLQFRRSVGLSLGRRANLKACVRIEAQAEDVRADHQPDRRQGFMSLTGEKKGKRGT